MTIAIPHTDGVDFLGDEEIEAQILDEHGVGDGLAEIAEELIREGVPMIEFCRRAADYPRLDSVVYIGNGFEFARYSDKGSAIGAMTFVIRDRFGHPIDIAAWSPPRRLALWHSRGCMLGEDRMFADARFNEAGALLVHSSPREWMCAGGRGVVPIDWAKASDLLCRAEPLQAASQQHGRELRARLEKRTPRIFVPTASDRKAS